MSSDMETSSVQRFTGCVKWFNNKSGYGFVTASCGDMQGNDIFVHHSSISVSNQQYKYLVQGEYVEFEISQLGADSEHQFQARSITGISKGKLMCETHFDTRNLRQKVRGDEPDVVMSAPKAPRKRTTGTRVRGDGPRGDAQTSASHTYASSNSDVEAIMG